MLATEVSATPVRAYAGPVTLLIWNSAIAVVLLVTFNRAFKAGLTLRLLFATVMCASLPALLKWLLSIEVVLGANADSFSLYNPSATNPGYFVDRASHPALGTLPTSLDVFTIWSLVLTAIGIACISRLTRGSAFGVIFGWFAVVQLALTAVAALST